MSQDPLSMHPLTNIVDTEYFETKEGVLRKKTFFDTRKSDILSSRVFAKRPGNPPYDRNIVTLWQALFRMRKES